MLVMDPVAGCRVAGMFEGVVVGALPQDRPGRVLPGIDHGEGLLGGGGAAALLRELALPVEPFAEGEAVVDGLDRRAEVAVLASPGTGADEGFGVGPGAGRPLFGVLSGDTDGVQQALLVGVELVVLEARPGDPAAQDGARCGDTGGGVVRFARFDVVAGAVVVALPLALPGRVPPRVDCGGSLCPSSRTWCLVCVWLGWSGSGGDGGGSGFVEGAVSEHGEQHADALAGESQECLGVRFAAGSLPVVVGA